MKRLIEVYAKNALRCAGNVLGVRAQERLCREVLAALEETFGPRRPAPESCAFTVEQAFIDGDFGGENHHVAGLSTLIGELPSNHAFRKSWAFYGQAYRRRFGGRRG